MKLFEQIVQYPILHTSCIVRPVLEKVAHFLANLYMPIILDQNAIGENH